MVLSVLLALLVGVGPQTLQTPDPNRVEDVRISGNRRIPSDTIKYNIKSMLAEKGHQDATVEATTESIPPNSIALTFKVDEGPKVRIEKINIEGNKVFSDRQVKKAMRLIKEAGPLTAFTSKDTYY